MRSIIFAVLSALPLLIAAQLGRGHHHVQGRAVTTEVVRVTQTVYTTLTTVQSLTATASQWTTVKVPTNAAPTTTAPTAPQSRAPLPEPSKAAGNPYAALVPEANKAIIVNSCDYDVYVSSVGDQSCGPGNANKLIPANTTYSEPIRTCYKSGIALKVAKTKDLSKPMQFEYAVWDDKKTISYDISYLDCMVERNGIKEFSDCVGQEKGIQAVSGEYCPVFHCLGGVECAQQAYTVPEFGYLPGAPVGACGVEKGIAFELCAENRR